MFLPTIKVDSALDYTIINAVIQLKWEKNSIYKTKNFHISLFFITFAVLFRIRAHDVDGWDIDILKKAFSGRFGFDLLELRKLKLIRQKQSNGKCLMKV